MTDTLDFDLTAASRYVAGSAKVRRDMLVALESRPCLRRIRFAAKMRYMVNLVSLILISMDGHTEDEDGAFG